jgi:hypothetical protein
MFPVEKILFSSSRGMATTAFTSTGRGAALFKPVSGFFCRQLYMVRIKAVSNRMAGNLKMFLML